MYVLIFNILSVFSALLLFFFWVICGVFRFHSYYWHPHRPSGFTIISWHFSWVLTGGSPTAARGPPSAKCRTPPAQTTSYATARIQCFRFFLSLSIVSCMQTTCGLLSATRCSCTSAHIFLNHLTRQPPANHERLDLSRLAGSLGRAMNQHKPANCTRQRVLSWLEPPNTHCPVRLLAALQWSFERLSSAATKAQCFQLKYLKCKPGCSGFNQHEFERVWCC